MIIVSVMSASSLSPIIVVTVIVVVSLILRYYSVLSILRIPTHVFLRAKTRFLVLDKL